MAMAKNGSHDIMDVVEGRITLDEFVSELSIDDLIHLLGGQPNTGVANTFGIGNMPEYGIPSVMTADGPAGVRIAPEVGICTTAFPSLHTARMHMEPGCFRGCRTRRR